MDRDKKPRHGEFRDTRGVTGICGAINGNAGLTASSLKVSRAKLRFSASFCGRHQPLGVTASFDPRSISEVTGSGSLAGDVAHLAGFPDGPLSFSLRRRCVIFCLFLWPTGSVDIWSAISGQYLESGR